MSDDVDVVVTLHALATYAENANHWTDDKRMMDASGVADTIYEAMDRIEELEANLAEAVEALGEAIYLLDPDEEDIAKETGLHRIVTTYAELTGGKDE